MKKYKMKILLSGILALLLVGCSGADSGGPSEGPGEGPSEDIVKPEEEVVIKTKTEIYAATKDFDPGTRSYEDSFDVLIPVYNDATKKIITNYEKLPVDGIRILAKGEDKEPQLVDYNKVVVLPSALLIEKDAHVEFDKDIDLPTSTLNEGNIYIVDTAVVFYNVDLTNPSSLLNDGKIYSIGDDSNQRLTIKGNYMGKENAEIYLGLFEEGGKIYTNKVDIGGMASGKTKIHFVFDKEAMDKKKNLELIKDDYVIKANMVKHSDGNSVFSVAGGTVPLGMHVYKLDYQPKGKFTKVSDEQYSEDNTWKLIKQD